MPDTPLVQWLGEKLGSEQEALKILPQIDPATPVTIFVALLQKEEKKQDDDRKKGEPAKDNIVGEVTCKP